MPPLSSSFSAGLEGVIAAQTAISSVDGGKGELVIRGFRIEELAPHASFEETVFLLWHDALPDAAALDRFRAELAAQRTLEGHTLELLKAAAARSVHPMDALRMAPRSLPLPFRIGSRPPGRMRCGSSPRSRPSWPHTTGSHMASNPWNRAKTSRTQRTSSACSAARRRLPHSFKRWTHTGTRSSITVSMHRPSPPGSLSRPSRT